MFIWENRLSTFGDTRGAQTLHPHPYDGPYSPTIRDTRINEKNNVNLPQRYFVEISTVCSVEVATVCSVEVSTLCSVEVSTVWGVEVFTIYSVDVSTVCSVEVSTVCSVEASLNGE